ncbi:hypothetical protein GCM10023322_46140 [Rugosimonospora acidiphila]|uniref:Uncharacterized protein n=1 Tax=Rugosimonospora acidiphila TaxID=556531 RepID=A0ABP9S2L9_9ACTN
MTGVDVVKAEGVPKKGAVRLGVATVNDHMSAIDHTGIIATRRAVRVNCGDRHHHRPGRGYGSGVGGAWGNCRVPTPATATDPTSMRSLRGVMVRT